MNNNHVKTVVRANIVATVLVGSAIVYAEIQSMKINRKSKELNDEIKAFRNTPLYSKFSPEAQDVLFGRNNTV